MMGCVGGVGGEMLFPIVHSIVICLDSPDHTQTQLCEIESHRLQSAVGSHDLEHPSFGLRPLTDDLVQEPVHPREDESLLQNQYTSLYLKLKNTGLHTNFCIHIHSVHEIMCRI